MAHCGQWHSRLSYQRPCSQHGRWWMRFKHRKAENTMSNKYKGTCCDCKRTVAANGGKLEKVGRTWLDSLCCVL